MDINKLKQREEIFQEFLNLHTGVGFLRVQVYTAQKTFPIVGASVKIWKEIENQKFSFGEYITDQHGFIPLLNLPTCPREHSLYPSDKKMYLNYCVEVSSPGFIKIVYYTINIFDNVISVQYVDLIPEGTLPGKQTQIDIFKTNPIGL